MSNATFERRIRFVPGYNYLHETGPQRRGQHGMEIDFALIGALGAVVFTMYTHWTPPGVVDAGSDLPVHIDAGNHGRYGKGLVMAPDGRNIGIHWRSQFADYLSGRDECGYLDGASCYSDSTFTGADPVLADLIKEGEKAVWRHLAEWYEEIASREAALA